MSELKIIPFMAKRKLAMFFSAALLLLSVGSLLFQGINFGLDFTGGMQVQLRFEQTPDTTDIQNKLDAANLVGVKVQSIGTASDVMIRLQEKENDKIAEQLVEILSEDYDNIQTLSSDFMSSVVGEEMKAKAIVGMIIALALVMLYVALRFQFKFSVGAVTALVHDVVIVAGFFSLLQIEFGLNELAAVLAVVGYSLNDTIVVSDRVRENFRTINRDDSTHIIDVSLSQTLGRTLVTSITTILVLLALFFFGGEVIHGFSIALLVGVIIGTYSSIYVAANILMMMNIGREDLMIKERAETDEEEIPSWLLDEEEEKK